MNSVKIKEYLKEYSYLKSMLSLLYWDMETMMPTGAIEDRAQRLSYIQGKIHQHITSKKYRGLLEEFKSKKLSSLEKKLVKELEWDFHIASALPLKHVKEITEAQALASHCWAQARKENDWKIFEPHLQKLIDLKKREAKFYGTKKAYDALLQLHDKEFTSTEIDKLFSELKNGLKKLKIDPKFHNAKDIPGPFNLEQQKSLNLFIAEKFGLSSQFSRLDTSEHPFSINISPRDQRITTRYFENNLDSLSSTMHEVGHALYEHNLPSQWEGTPFQDAVSLSVHESQSRLWENVIGRSREFCQFLLPELKKRFPHNMKGLNSEKIFYAMNQSRPGLIRVESPELYYNYHVIIRYEIEAQIFNGDLKTNDIPQLWNEKYRDFLGLVPATASEGVLQDSHWAGGSFGYFPTYTLGNLISGSLWKKMRKEIPAYHQKILDGDFAPILTYLNKNIHSKGRGTTAKQIVGKLNCQDYLEYLDNKFKA